MEKITQKPHQRVLNELNYTFAGLVKMKYVRESSAMLLSARYSEVGEAVWYGEALWYEEAATRLLKIQS